MRHCKFDTIVGKDFLENCLVDTKAHADLLHLFAVLESMGARKIHRMMRFCSFFSEEMLSHAAEEARHALFFAKRYRQLTGHPIPPVGNSDLERQGHLYFRSLDLEIGRIVQELKPKNHHEKTLFSYLLTTKAIEHRALDIYHDYEETIGSVKKGFSVRSILTEEERHLRDIDKQLELHAIGLRRVSLFEKNL